MVTKLTQLIEYSFSLVIWDATLHMEFLDIIRAIFGLFCFIGLSSYMSYNMFLISGRSFIVSLLLWK